MVLRGLRIRLLERLDMAEAYDAVSIIERLYEQALNDDDINFKRGMLLELLAYSFIESFYKAQECMMQCHIYQLGKRVNAQEIDVCAWSDEGEIGEAYECKTNPHFITDEHCTTLIHLAEVAQPFAKAFRIGAISFESQLEVEYRLAELGADLRILSFGWDNLEDLRTEPGPLDDSA